MKEREKMYFVLVFGMTENPGGVETLIMDYYRRIDKSKIQFDFLCNSYNQIVYEDEIKELGGKTIHFPARSKSLLEYKKSLKTFFEQNAKKYDAIWVNVCSLANIDYLILAKKYGISRRIIHSHNSQNMEGILRKTLHLINKKRIKKIATDYWACSQGAARWFYEDELIDKVEIIHNAIDVKRMHYDENAGNNLREKYGWKNKIIIGNVGRLHFQKNQMFMLDIFKNILQVHPNAILVLIGQGEDEQKIRNKIQNLNIQNSVFLMGLQNNIREWLSTFDLFLFPSVFEGLSIAAMEAQASGVSILASEEVIPKEVKLNENLYFCSLDQNAETWANKACEVLQKKQRIPSEKIEEEFQKSGYDIDFEAKNLEDRFIKKK